MFLKNSKVYTWIFCLLGALLLAGGICIADTDTVWNGVEGTSEAVGSSIADLDETHISWEEETLISQVDDESVLQNTTVQESSKENTQVTGVSGDSGYSAGGVFRIPPWTGTVLLLAGMILSGVYVVLLRQKKPYLGPEAELFLLSMGLGGIVLTVLYMNTYFSVIYLWLLCILLLIGARGIWGWIMAGVSFKWSSMHRIGWAISRQTRKVSRYMAVQLGGILLAAAGAILLFRAEPLDFLRVLLGISCLTIMVLSFVCLIHGLQDMDHLTGQIGEIHQGSSLPVQEGIFAAYEEQLVDFNRQREEAVQTAVTSERFRVDLIANVSHDLRTPLTAILGYGELLKKEALSEDGDKQLTELNRKAGYMRELVDSLFELTKVSSGVIACKKEQIDLIRLLEQTIGLFDDKLQERNLQIRRHYSVERLPVVTDGARMHQVFANLIGNAIKYTLANTRIHLEVKEEADTCTVRLVNIASYEMDFQPEEIIQRFARGDKARTTRGSGLGLAIAQTYTESVGGTFAVAVDGEQFSAVVTLPRTDDLQG